MRLSETAGHRQTTAPLGATRLPPAKVFDLTGWQQRPRYGGLGETRPVRSAGLASLKSIRPGRDDRRMLAIAEPRAKPKAECFYRPYGTDLSFCFISQRFVLGYFR